MRVALKASQHRNLAPQFGLLRAREAFGLDLLAREGLSREPVETPPDAGEPAFANQIGKDELTLEIPPRDGRKTRCHDSRIG